MKKSDKQNALLIQRIIAYILDAVIIAIIATLISYPFYDNANMEKLNNTSSELATKYMDKKIDTKTYIDENKSINYEMSRKSGIITLITILLSVLYFVCYQLYTKGQTLGKRLMRIRILDKDENDLSMNQLIYRSLIINSILINIILMALVIFTNKDIYFYGTITLNIIQYIIIIVSVIMIIFTKDSRGLHDIICNTKVVRDNAVKELETCES